MKYLGKIATMTTVSPIIQAVCTSEMITRATKYILISILAIYYLHFFFYIILWRVATYFHCTFTQHWKLPPLSLYRPLP